MQLTQVPVELGRFCHWYDNAVPVALNAKLTDWLGQLVTETG